MITIEAKANTQNLDAAVKRAANLVPAMKGVAQVLHGETLKAFRQGGRTPGEWPRSRRAMEKGGKTLVARGILRNSITTASNADSAEVGTALFNAGVLHNGATIHAKKTITIRPKRARLLAWTGPGGQKRFAKSVTQRLLRWKVGDKWVAKPSVTIPPRPFLPLDDSGNLMPNTERRIRALLTRYIIGDTHAAAASQESA